MSERMWAVEVLVVVVVVDGVPVEWAVCLCVMQMQVFLMVGW